MAEWQMKCRRCGKDTSWSDTRYCDRCGRGVCPECCVQPYEWSEYTVHCHDCEDSEPVTAEIWPGAAVAAIEKRLADDWSEPEQPGVVALAVGNWLEWELDELQRGLADRILESRRWDESLRWARKNVEEGETE